MPNDSNYQRTIRDLSKSAERLRAEIAQDPMMAAMSEALRLTPDEQAASSAAQQAVTEAEVAVNAAGFALVRARRGMAPTYDRKQPFSFFQKSPGTHKAAADVPRLRIDLEESRTALQTAIRRRNDTAHTIEVDRRERRRTAKLAHMPKLPPVQSRGDHWNRSEAF